MSSCLYPPCCLRAHDDEVLDVTFDYTGQHLATASTDGKCLLSTAAVVSVYLAYFVMADKAYM